MSWMVGIGYPLMTEDLVFPSFHAYHKGPHDARMDNAAYVLPRLASPAKVAHV